MEFIISKQKTAGLFKLTESQLKAPQDFNLVEFEDFCVKKMARLET
ncbi:hypothetical protein LB450_09805 [Psychroflexus sp. CAK1W]|nr:hypothetical protein [Psychroflexus curvus]MBZ9628391.1 hypothetical protein [Psychroflexus curvus]